MIRTDHHIHTRYCGHATGEVAEYTKSAQAKKMEYLGFADHLPLPADTNGSQEGLALREEDLPNYIEDVKREAEDNGMQIALGTEADFLPGHEKETAAKLKKNGFDFAIGSVHFIGNWNFDYTEETFQEGRRNAGDEDEPYRQYYGLVKMMVKSGIFQIAGHLDLIKKFGYAPKKSSPDTICEILDMAKKKGMAVEVNTAGIDKKTGEIYPSEEILRMCFERDIDITVGSDAHSPTEIGRHFGKAEELLRRTGYTSITTFTKGKKRQVPL